MRIFINDVGRLRSGWRLLLFAAAFTGLFVMFVVGLRVFYVAATRFLPSIPYADFLSNFVFRVALISFALGAGYLCVRFLEGLPFRSLGIGFHRGFIRDFVLGSVIGGVSVTIGVMTAFGMGGLRFSLNTVSAAGVAKSVIGAGILFFVAALAEEAMFRGYPIQTLTRAKLAWFGVLLTSVPFGLGHLWNPNVIPGVTLANTILAGVWFGVAYLKTRSLWFPWGLHLAWNFVLGALFGLPVSGLMLVSQPLLRGEDIGPQWLTGGSYGIEGGVAATIALTVSTLVIWFLPWPGADPELKRLTSEENPSLRP
jgi:membrane protease YdiL (CAAX protease family)